MSLIDVLKANGIHVGPDSREAYLPLILAGGGIDSFERKIAEEVAKRVTKSGMIKITVSEEKHSHDRRLVFLTDINLAGRGDASDITGALKAAKELFKRSIALLAVEAVAEAACRPGG